MRTAAAATALALLVAPAAGAHKFHASMVTVEYNEREKVAEISIRLFTDDLEESLGRRAGKRVRIGLTPDVERLSLDYVAERLRIEDREGRPLALEWVGLEPRVDVVWVYVQAAAPVGLGGARVEDRIFFDLFDDQVNHVVVKQGRLKSSLVFKPGTPALTVALE